MVVAILLLAAPTLLAQEVLNWHDFELCDDCELEVSELVRLGDADGPGIIESDMMLAAWGEELGYLLSPLGGTGIKIFDHDGTFIREIGGEGDGPGEFRSIYDLDVIDGRIVVLDGTKSAVVILSPEGEYITQHPLPGRRTVYARRPGADSRDCDQKLAHESHRTPAPSHGPFERSGHPRIRSGECRR
ncbi:MAG: 6-bladed beta-propeller [Gemmatimonadota bacterium]|nr:6-bladed beta-propeller [Gemmatimonadota bacterium]